MSIPGSLTPLFSTGAGGAAGYQVERSLRFNSTDSAYLSRTPAVAGNRRTWTWAGWVKRSALNFEQNIFTCMEVSNAFNTNLMIQADNTITVYDHISNPNTGIAVRTTQVFRDVSAWFHVVLAYNTTQATASDKLKLYINGTEVTQFSTDNRSGLTSDSSVNRAAQHSIGSRSPFPSGEYFDGYLADVYFIDGQALTPSSFTEVSATTGQLIPKAYSGGSYGTNGFQLKFADNSSNTAATLGKDTSGNSNNWTPNNLSVTAGAGNDSLVDTPTSYGTDTGVGGEVRGNYATWNPLQSNAGTLTNGNLDASVTTTNARSTIALPSGKWYAEVTMTSVPDLVHCGVIDGGIGTYVATYISNGQKTIQDSSSAYGATYTTSDVIGIAVDVDAKSAQFFKNGVSQGTFNWTTGYATYYLGFEPRGVGAGARTATANFGQRAFAYQTPGTNRPAATFLALCDTNLGAPLTAKPNTLMDVALYTGNGGTQTISGLNFSPDFVWIKGRSGATQHEVYDTNRGVEKALYTNLTTAEETHTNSLSSFTSDGFSIGNRSTINSSSATYVAWTWDAGTSTVSNTAGSITSQVRANVSAGFSVITYTGNGGSNVSVGHGLGVAPVLLIVKSRSTSGDWDVTYTFGDGSYDFMSLNTTAAKLDITGRNAPTSTLFYVNGGLSNVNATTYVCYAFSPVVGYSSFGSYTGNGSSDGPFVYTGMRPRWLMVKSTGSGAWIMHDTSRNPYNASVMELQANDSTAEYNTNTFSAGDRFDILSNGFKSRTSNSYNNSSAQAYIYIAFAESPFQYARAR